LEGRDAFLSTSPPKVKDTFGKVFAVDGLL
jgi:hypothetical protein